MKLSFVMQAFLGEYPGSRKDSVEKFNRVVQSIIDQSNPNWELIIVSDGCEITMDQYYTHYEGIPNIKFAYVDKPAESRMYGENSGFKYYRGLPREVGRSMATGDWVGYVDSDDFIIKDGVEKLIAKISMIEEAGKQAQRDIKFIFNDVLIENEIMAGIVKVQRQKNNGVLSQGMFTFYSDFYKIPGLDSTWIDVGLHESVGMGTVFMWHKKDFPQHGWKDINTDDVTISEDVLFAEGVLYNQELRPYVTKMSVPYYVRCHHAKLWDF